ncbi:hypothetical protein ETB97_000941 [Aspergillus alliaceus]|uniref:Centrosomin N-terminal motif 1 domain-containing protein n=1 Tax=Petromyces alliaceus TaxID=209559 RepID=A0A8H6A4K6_PETAA|nr:hypothetical protein ETB97_000941 [Aspergillus burnettii]
MDKTPQRRSTVSVHSTTPSSLRHCLYPSPVTALPAGNASPRHSPNLKNNSQSPKPAALTHVKRRLKMDNPSQTSSDMSWPYDPSVMTGSPKPSSQSTRSRTPEPGTTSLVNPSSSLLQDLLKEQRATRGSRGTASEDMDDNAPPTPRTPRTPGRSRSNSQTQSQEEPGSERQRKINNALAAGLKQPREMGMREMDQYISKINKQNFDLKLEIFHRAQQMMALEKKLERMLEMEEELQRMRGLEDELQELRDAEEDNQRLRESNEQLRQEIDKRDQAVTEAVELICQLEARVEELEATGDASRPSTARPSTRDGPGPDIATPKTPTPVDIPERTSSRRGTILTDQYRRRSSGTRHLKRAPSFLHDENQNAAVLRSVYSPADEQSRSEMSILTNSESLHSMNGTAEPDSPRLSALSECSELHMDDITGSYNGFDEIEIPMRKRESTAQSSVLSSLTGKDWERDQLGFSSWNQAQPDTASEETPRKKNRPALDVFRDTDKPSFESVSYADSSAQKTQVDSVFGSSRLPPTPDTMSTAHAFGTNRSNGSSADKSQLDHIVALKRGLRRPRSADELTTRRSSGNSRQTDGTDTNISEVMHPPLSTDEGDEAPAIFPLNCVSSRTSYLQHHGVVRNSNFGYYGSGALFNEDDLESVLSKIDDNYYSTSRRADAEEPLEDTPSSSPPLTPQDWVEAAKSDNHHGKSRPLPPATGPVPVKSRLASARAPSQSSFLGRRHSVDSTVQDIPAIPTLDLNALEPVRQPEPDPEPRRRLSFRPRFFGRSTANRRLQPSPIPDGADEHDGAPSPVIPKARQMESSKPASINQNDNLYNSHDNGRPSAPTYADSKGDDIHKTLPHSFTDSNMLSHSTASRPPSSHGKGHKRRSSLGIFGWMKGAGGFGSSNKKSELDSTMSIQSNGSAKDRSTSRLVYEIPVVNPEISEAHLASMNIAVEDFASSTKRISWTTEDEAWRPRYIDRRRRV